MEISKANLYDRANELLAEITELQEQLEHSDNSPHTYARIAVEMKDKRRQLDFVRQVLGDLPTLGKV